MREGEEGEGNYRPRPPMVHNREKREDKGGEREKERRDRRKRREREGNRERGRREPGKGTGRRGGRQGGAMALAVAAMATGKEKREKEAPAQRRWPKGRGGHSQRKRG